MKNITIKKKLKNTDIKLNKKFYSIIAVKEGINDFKDLCNFEVSEEPQYIKVNIELKNGVDADKVSYEFYNYVLGLMKNNVMV